VRRYLVVANQTLAGAALAAKVKQAQADDEAEFHIIVPATAPTHTAYSEGEARAVAAERLERALEWFSSAGAKATGEVVDEHALYAIGDALREQAFDEVIISTLPKGMSKWLKQDLPRRARREYGLPVTHVIGEAPSTSKSA
jgi:hypothetical protein